MKARGRKIKAKAKATLRGPAPRGRAAVAASHSDGAADTIKRELAEAREQQAATAEVLKVISRSAFDLQTVLDTLVESAARLCDAHMACIVRPQEGKFIFSANYRFPRTFVDLVTGSPISGGYGTMAGRVLAGRRTIHIPDVHSDHGYTFKKGRKAGGYKTLLGIPLLAKGLAIGVIVLARKRVQPFSSKQIALVTTFADQAVIAIENVRLFEAEQRRTVELRESLEQQTATSEILKVISNSPTDMQPVFDVIVQSGLRLFSNAAITIGLPRDGMVHAVAVGESNPGRADAWRRQFPFPLTREYMHGACILDGEIVDIPDVRKAPKKTAPGPTGSWRPVTAVSR